LDLEGVLDALQIVVWDKCNLPGFHPVTALVQVACEKAQGIRDVIEQDMSTNRRKIDTS
jgi:hypothetical protein